MMAPAKAQAASAGAGNFAYGDAFLISIGILLLVVIAVAVSWLLVKTKAIASRENDIKEASKQTMLDAYLTNLDSGQIETLINVSRQKAAPGKGRHTKAKLLSLLTGLFLCGNSTALLAQPSNAASASLSSEGGIIITVVLILTPIVVGILLLVVKIINSLKQYQNKQNLAEAERLAAYLKTLPAEAITPELQKRKAALDFQLSHTELSGNLPAEDEIGLLNNIDHKAVLPIVAVKKKAQKRPNIDPQLSKLVLWYIGCATFWLLFGTTLGEYLGIKFVAPDADHFSWLSFGRLRPVHTNSVFWGWASLGMLGLGYYVVPRVSNTPLYSLKAAWYALYLINAAVIIGSISLMAGLNNGGGEYREYIWPIMLLFGIGLVLTLINYLKTIARRTTKEIYISNWYIVAAVMFALVIAVVAYVPLWQDGLGETIIQGYYMHQGVGMWFMLFTLGIVYYYLPQQLNKPIYSYSLGILAFWTQILFYTLIGTHHFVFSSIPWALQTVAIVGSAGMAIPVIAGTTNFLMTFKGAWHKIAGSYTLPFFLVGIVFYFTGSMQGTAEAFRSTNLIWHFTDFTVAHSHLTMYGIICFFLWAGMYAVIPRLTGKEPPQITVGAHFWLALIGLLFYTIPLMYGSTMKGLMWLEGKPFIEGVVFMAPFWLWRAIGGSLMWLSHLFFAYNFYRMIARNNTIDVKTKAFELLSQDIALNEEKELAG
ncbi:cytochrome oxidase subunit I [Pedobacter sp. BS3]|nr:cytochrome oxidase subunit I [Pedobacter sp. BS3]